LVAPCTLTDESGALARWLCTDQAKALEQEEFDPKPPNGFSA
jgi:hypothetical protein